MAKRVWNVPAIVLSVFGVVVLGFVIVFAYMSLNGMDYSQVYSQRISSGNITNPLEMFVLQSPPANLSGYEEIKINTSDGEKSIFVNPLDLNMAGLTTAEAEKELINYASVILKIYNLHNIPFTSITPKIQVNIDSNSYYLEVSDGKIIIHDGFAAKPDIIVRTTSEEILKIIANHSYAQKSISEGKTKVIMSASKFVLLTKGYLGVYLDLTSAANSYGVNTNDYTSGLNLTYPSNSSSSS